MPPSGIGIEVRTRAISISGSWIVIEFAVPIAVNRGRHEKAGAKTAPDPGPHEVGTQHMMLVPVGGGADIVRLNVRLDVLRSGHLLNSISSSKQSDEATQQRQTQCVIQAPASAHATARSAAAS